jgi:hypothetical protein
MTDDQAYALITEQEARSRDPEYLQSRAVEDEAFKERAFGACLMVVGIAFVTVILCVVIIVFGAHRRSMIVKQDGQKPLQTYTNSPSAVPLITGNDLPQYIGGAKIMRLDTSLVLPGSLTKVEQAVYSDGVQIYAVPSVGLSDDQLAALRLAVSFAAKQHTPELLQSEVVSQAGHYIILASTQKLGIDAKSALPIR